MKVTFYDFEFNRLKDCPNPISLNLERCYCGFGGAELHFDICQQDIIRMLEDNEYLFFIAETGSAIVTGWQLGEDIAIYGRTPEWLLTKRGAEPLSFSGVTAEVIARNALESVSDFVTLGALSNVGMEMEYSTEGVRSLYDVVCEVLKTQGLGFTIFPDVEAMEFVFYVYKGTESLCMFSPSNRTAYNMAYRVEKQDSVTNSGWYERQYKDMGNWNAISNSPRLLNNEPTNAYTFYKISSDETIQRFGLNCVPQSYIFCDNSLGTWEISEIKPKSMWVYLDNSEKTGIQKWDTVLRGIKTEEEAKAEISQMIRRESVDCEVYRFEYGKDYQLGDIVRVQMEFEDFKKSEKKRVASVNIYYDTDKSGVIPQLKSLEE